MKLSKATLERLREEARDFAMMRQEMFISACVVSELLEAADKVEQLKKEANWLALCCEKFCLLVQDCEKCFMFQGANCPNAVGGIQDVHDDLAWREAAHKAVEGRNERDK